MSARRAGGLKKPCQGALAATVRSVEDVP
jgi:hypothetical protein